METTIYDFCTSSYIPAIHKFALNIPHVHIVSMNHCGESRQTAFKRPESFQDMLYFRDNADMVVAIFPHQIQSQYYGGNRYVSIEGITL